MKFLGIKRLFVSNACGGVNPPSIRATSMALNDHINLFPNALAGQEHR